VGGEVFDRIVEPLSDGAVLVVGTGESLEGQQYVGLLLGGEVHVEGIDEHDGEFVVLVLEHGDEAEELGQLLDREVAVLGDADGLEVHERHVQAEELALEAADQELPQGKFAFLLCAELLFYFVEFFFEAVLVFQKYGIFFGFCFCFS